MKVFGVVVLVLGFVVMYIGITGSQHRIMDILKGIHLAPNVGSGASASFSPSNDIKNLPDPFAGSKGVPNAGGGGKKHA